MKASGPTASPHFQPESPIDGFGRVAWFYDTLAGIVFGSALRRAQRAALANLPAGAPQVLILGGGTGWVLLELLRARPQATVRYVEASAAMLARSAARLQQYLPQCVGQVVFCHGTDETLPGDIQVDAVVTFFVLDCFEPVPFAQAILRLTAVARPEAVWLVADFQPPRTWGQQMLLRLMYCFFRLTTGLRATVLPDWPAALTELNWQPVGDTADFYGGAVLAGSFRRFLAD